MCWPNAQGGRVSRNCQFDQVATQLQSLCKFCRKVATFAQAKKLIIFFNSHPKTRNLMSLTAVLIFTSNKFSSKQGQQI